MLPLEAIKNDKALFETAVRQITPEILGSIIDQTLLNPTATSTDIVRLCQEAHDIGSFICVNGSRIRDAKKCIEKEKLTKIRGIAAVIGFPFGAELTREKVAGALGALVDEGADEVDMVLNYGKLLGGGYGYVETDIKVVAEMVKTAQEKTGKKKILKVIQENCCLSPMQKQMATTIIINVATAVRIHMFVKTSTGFGTPKDKNTPKGATLDDVHAMKVTIRLYNNRGVPLGIKAAGGVGDAETAVKMMLAGGCFNDDMKLFPNLSDIFRIGASSGVKIVDDFKENFC